MKGSPKYGLHTFNVLCKFTDRTDILKCDGWSFTYLPYMNTCPVCMLIIVRPFRLKCNHTICIKCATQASLQKRNRCPLCTPKTSEQKVLDNQWNRVQTSQRSCGLRECFPRACTNLDLTCENRQSRWNTL